jgi:prepilin-type N-terminal cleavage/methylation domain-containing protein/prepilin-type processing-associated H-X9-DG protein
MALDFGLPVVDNLSGSAYHVFPFVRRHIMVRWHKVRAFTLIELLVVVAIIALLIAILLPALGAAKEKGIRLQCAVNMRSLSVAENLYAAANGNKVPRSTDGTNPFWVYAIAKNQGYVIPGDDGKGLNYGTFGPVYSTMKMYICPAYPSPPLAVCYISNAFQKSGVELLEVKIDRVPNANQTINYAEVCDKMPQNFNVFDLWADGHVNEASGNMGVPTEGGSEVRILHDDRHGGYMNASFYDVHVEQRKYNTIGKADFLAP